MEIHIGTLESGISVIGICMWKNQFIIRINVGMIKLYLIVKKVQDVI